LNGLRLDIMDSPNATEYAVKFISDTYYARVYRVKLGKNRRRRHKTWWRKTEDRRRTVRVHGRAFNERRMFVVVAVAVLVLLT
jgi:hypothetical protein